MRADKKTSLKADKKAASRAHTRSVVGYSKKSALLEDAITQMNAGKYGRSSAALKELLALDPLNMEARRLFATLHLRLGSLLPARQAFESLANEALERQDYWLAESLLREYLAAGPRCVPFLEKLGAVYQEKGDALAASEEFAKAIDVLIEDPDADRPARPAELYAKIRELAPASPPAFRLASLFDAQSGDLIAPAPTVPAAQSEEALVPPVGFESPELLAPALTTVMPDPVLGVMPWDDVPADSPGLPVQRVQLESTDQAVSSMTALPESAAELPTESVASLLLVESLPTPDAIIAPASEESSSLPSFSIPSSDSVSSVVPPEAEPALVEPRHEEQVSANSAFPASEWGVDSLPIPQDLRGSDLSEVVNAAQAEQPFQSDEAISVASPASDVPPGPLPWEHVGEATSAISQAEGESLSADLSSVEAIVSVAPETLPAETVHPEGLEETQKETSSVLAGDGPLLSLATTQEFSPDIVWAAPDVSVAKPVDSSAMSPEPSLASPVSDLRQLDAGGELVVQPLPWEQVQESSGSSDDSNQESVSFQAEAVEVFQEQRQESSLSDIGVHDAPQPITTSSGLAATESHDAIAPPAVVEVSHSENPPSSGQSPKIGEFSWASIFNSAWKFGSSSPASYDSLHHPSQVEPAEPAESVSPDESVAAPLLQEEPTPVVLTDKGTECITGSADPAVPVASPMPWDPIQETPVTIPPVDIAFSSPVELLVEPAVAPAVPIEISDERAAHQDASVSAPVLQEALVIGVPPSEVVGAPTIAPNPLGAESVEESISWDLIEQAPVAISSVDVALSAPVEPLVEPAVVPITPTETLDEGAVQDIPVASAVLQEDQMIGVPFDDKPGSIAAAAYLIDVEPVVLSMPWDSIQDAPVAIPPADIAFSAPVEPLVEPAVAPTVSIVTSDESAAQKVSVDASFAEESTVSEKVLIEEAQPVEAAQVASVELPFRFIDSTNAEVEASLSEEAPQRNYSTSPSEQAAAVTPMASIVLAETIAPAPSEEFRIVSQTEPMPTGHEARAIDAPVVSMDPVPVRPAELALPVLPHELLPVLQTLVDQLSVVTKTIPVEKISPEPVTHEEAAPPTTSLREPSQAPSSAELAANPSSAQMPQTEAGPPSQWKTGEVAVQTHRPAAKKRKHLRDQASAPAPSFAEDQSAAETEPVPAVASIVIDPAIVVPPPASEKEEWIKTGEAIRFIDPKVTESAPPPVPQEEWAADPVPSAAASAVDVLFHSSGPHTQTQTIERTAAPKPRPRLRAKVARARIGLVVFAGSCFSTSRALVTSLVGLVALSGALLAMGVGGVGLAWLVMEEKPSAAFRSLTTTPQRTMMDSNKNGYLLLLGFEAAAAADPVQIGHERKPDAKDREMMAACQGGDEGSTGANQKNASASVAQGWYRATDPAGQFKAQSDSLKGWMSQANGSMGRYRQWLKMPFEDWGHGQSVTPPCAAILFAHRLHVAEGFSQGASMEIGVERLESDMEVWRTTLGQAKTLPLKMMALQAINDDIAVASGLLVKPDFDGKVLPRITKMLRPLDPVESSMRWPMQSELVLAAKSYEAELDADRGEDVPLHVSVASMLPLPKQRRLNDYAEYYEASYKAAGEGRYGAMPKRTSYIKYPANGVMDYLTNPIENIIGVDPLPVWDRYNGLVIDTDAHLRLASLQAWLRRGPQDADLLARIAKAGQRLYDPYTGLPMLVNLRQGVMYSVGHDGKDQDADPKLDVVVSIPLNQSSSTAVKPAAKSK